MKFNVYVNQEQQGRASFRYVGLYILVIEEGIGSEMKNQ